MAIAQVMLIHGTVLAILGVISRWHTHISAKRNEKTFQYDAFYPQMDSS